MIYWPFIRRSTIMSVSVSGRVGRLFGEHTDDCKKKPPINLGGGGGHAKWIVGPVD